MKLNKIYNKDCLEGMKELDADSIDTIITDPPYGIKFMNKRWDYDVPSVKIWEECLRVLKPGGTVLCFAGTRTQHRMAINIEDAGFEIRDCIMWIFGGGFPKSYNVSKGIDKVGGRNIDIKKFQLYLKRAKEKSDYTNKQLDKMLGFSIKGGGMFDHFINNSQPQFPNTDTYKKMKDILNLNNEFDDLIVTVEREITGVGSRCELKDKMYFQKNIDRAYELGKAIGYGKWDLKDKAVTPEAKQWEGYGTSLKPAYEPIIVAMKPNDGTYAHNALTWGVGGLNIDECRVGTCGGVKKINITKNLPIGCNGDLQELNKGRFPANVILDEVSAEMLDKQSGTLKSGSIDGVYNNTIMAQSMGNRDGKPIKLSYKGNKGGASRFFYCAKASKSERNAGCDGLENSNDHFLSYSRWCPDCNKSYNGSNDHSKCSGKIIEKRSGKNITTNIHPTVKPLALMKYLCTLTKTPTGGIVLDPFMGSGTTAVACKIIGREYIGFEQSKEYCEIANKRVDDVLDRIETFM